MVSPLISNESLWHRDHSCEAPAVACGLALHQVYMMILTNLTKCGVIKLTKASHLAMHDLDPGSRAKVWRVDQPYKAAFLNTE